jgi:hypothetical protein
MRVYKDQLAEMIDETDWAGIAAMTEADIECAAAEGTRSTGSLLRTVRIYGGADLKEWSRRLRIRQYPALSR